MKRLRFWCFDPCFRKYRVIKDHGKPMLRQRSHQRTNRMRLSCDPTERLHMPGHLVESGIAAAWSSLQNENAREREREGDLGQNTTRNSKHISSSRSRSTKTSTGSLCRNRDAPRGLQQNASIEYLSMATGSVS